MQWHSTPIRSIESNVSIHVYILLGQPATIKVDVKMPENYPVDLYYLMDLSGSMVEDLKKFPTLGQQIGNYGFFEEHCHLLVIINRS